VEAAPDLSAGVAAFKVDFNDPSFALAQGVALRRAEGSPQAWPLLLAFALDGSTADFAAESRLLACKQYV